MWQIFSDEPYQNKGDYHQALQDYNTYLGLFPNNVFARWAGFARNNHYFEAPAAARQAPKVEFPAPKR